MYIFFLSVIHWVVLSSHLTLETNDLDSTLLNVTPELLNSHLTMI